MIIIISFCHTNDDTGGSGNKPLSLSEHRYTPQSPYFHPAINRKNDLLSNNIKIYNCACACAIMVLSSDSFLSRTQCFSSFNQRKHRK